VSHNLPEVKLVIANRSCYSVPATSPLALHHSVLLLLVVVVRGVVAHLGLAAALLPQRQQT